MITCRNRGQNRLVWLRAALLSSFVASGLQAVAVAAPAAPAADDYAGLPPKVQQFMRDADASLKTGNMNLAVIDLKNAVQLAPGAGEPRARLGLALARQGDAVTAERELRQAQKDGAKSELVVPGILQVMLLRNETKQLLAEFLDPPDQKYASLAPTILLARTTALQRLGRAAEAKSAINEALRLRRNVPTLLAAATLARGQNDLTLARQLVDEVLKPEPANLTANTLSIDMYRQAGQLQKALAEADELMKLSQGDVNGDILRVQVLLDLNRVADAKSDIDTLLMKAPRSGLAHFYHAVIMARTNDAKGAWAELVHFRPQYFQTQAFLAMQAAQIGAASGNTEAGAAILSTFVARNPDYLPARVELAALRLGQKSPNAALDLLEPVKDLDNPQVQMLLAQAYLQTNHYSEATAILQKAVASPAVANNDLLKRQLAVSEVAAGNTAKAIEVFEDLEKRDPGNPAVAGQLSMALFRSGKTDQALAVMDRMAKAQPKSALPAFYRGVILGAEGKLTDAAAELTRAIAADPKFVPARFYRSDIALAQGNPDTAKADLQQILVQEPASFAAYIHLAQIALNEGRDSDVIPLLDKAVAAASGAPTPRMVLARYQLSVGKYQDALSSVNTLLQLTPNDPEALALRGQIQLASGNQKDAIATFRALVATDQQAPGAQILLANALRAVKDNTGAENAIRKAIGNTPATVQLQQTLIGFQLADGKPDAALATAREYASSYPGTAADLLMADTLMRLKRVADATAILAKSYAERPDGGLARGLVQAELASGDSKKALATISDWVRKNPTDFAMHVQYASMLMQTGDQNNARLQFEGLLKQRPEDPIVLNNLGWLVQKDDPARALSLVSLAAKISPRSPQIVDTLGWLKFERNDSQGAVTLLKLAHDLKSDDPEIGYHFALALDATGKRAEAKTLLKSVLARNTQFEDAVAAQKLIARW